MNRLPFLVIAGSVAASGASLRLLSADPPVNLQASSPGTAQTGHVNVSGTVLAGNVGASDASSAARAISGSATAATGTTFGGVFQSASTGGRGVYGSADASSGSTFGGYFRASSTSGVGVYGAASATTGTTYGGYFTSTADVGVFGKGGKAGGRFENSGSSGYAVYALSSASGAAVFAQATDSDGIFSISSGGDSKAGIRAYAQGSSGYGVFGQATAYSGVTFGGRFSSTSTGGYGVYANGHYGGYFKSSGDGFNYGLTGTSDSNLGSGVVGSSTSPTGTAAGVRALAESSSGRAIYASANSASGATYGVYGRVDSLTDGYGVYCGGKLAASGTKSFRIDHPLDPKNMYLLHYCTEGPEPTNAYRGIVVTDGGGYATVQLPDYFESINRDPSYQLTVIDDSDDFVLAKVTQGVVQGKFRIRTSKPNVRVCWRVEAVRNDAFVKRYGAPTEVDKPKGERGTYVHPELYGESAELGLDYGQSKFRPLDPKPVR